MNGRGGFMENDLLETIHELWRMIVEESLIARLDRSLSLWERGAVVRGVSYEPIEIDTAMGQIA